MGHCLATLPNRELWYINCKRLPNSALAGRSRQRRFRYAPTGGNGALFAPSRHAADPLFSARPAIAELG